MDERMEETMDVTDDASAEIVDQMLSDDDADEVGVEAEAKEEEEADEEEEAEEEYSVVVAEITEEAS